MMMHHLTTPMLIEALDVFSYRLPLVRPLPLSTGTLTEREGLALRLQAEGGAVGWGEAAPLPGFSPETLDEARAQALALARQSRGVNVREVAARAEALVPSLRFAVGMTVCSVQAEAQGQSMQTYLGRQRETVELNGLIVAEALQDQAETLRARGYRCVKLKVGRIPIDDEVERVREVLKALDEDIVLRLDANRGWSPADALTFARSVDLTRIEYIEEPVQPPEALRDLAKAGLPIALDETIYQQNLTDLHPYAFARAFVLKPTLLGFQRTRRLAEQAEQIGCTVTLSAAFESGLAMSAHLALAASLPAADTPAGLDTYGWLADDILQPRPAFEGPFVDLADWQYPAINHHRLTPDHG